MKKAFLLMAPFLVIYSCNEAVTPTPAAEKSIDLVAAQKVVDSTNLVFSNGMSTGDSAAVIGIYTANAQILAPNMPLMTDRASMGPMVKSLPAMGIKKFTVKSSELLNGGDYLIETGTYDMGDSTKSFDQGKYIVIWKQEDGKWKIHRDIWNSNNPPMISTPH